MKISYLNNLTFLTIFLTIFVYICFIPALFSAETVSVGWDSDRWQKQGALVKEFEGEKCLSGLAVLKDVEFQDGVIEADIYFDGSRTYAGLVFRFENRANFEEIYLRPHAPNLWNTVQYAPAFNGMAEWQLYYMNNGTSPYDIKPKTWIHMRLEIKGTQARLFLDDNTEPTLVMDDLGHGISKGKIGVKGPRGNQVLFKNFKYTLDNNLKFNAPPKVHNRPGIIKDWKLTGPLQNSLVNRDVYPSNDFLSKAKWIDVKAAANGMVHVNRAINKNQIRVGAKAIAMAKTTIHSDKDQIKKVAFGYSDEISIFLNGNPLYYGDSTYTSRDPKFAGVIGWNDVIYLPLKKGENELFIILGEWFGGWAYQMAFEDFYTDSYATLEGTTSNWKLNKGLSVPESVAYSSDEKALFISNYFNMAAPNQKKEYITKTDINGKVLEEKWIDGINKPTGLQAYKGRLYVVVRDGISIIDLKTKKEVEKISIEKPGFLNDLVIEEASGEIYVSDSQKSQILRYANKKLEVWLGEGKTPGSNGLHIADGKLYVGCIQDGVLRTVDLKTKEVKEILALPRSAVDGIKSDGKGGILVGDFRGFVYRIDKAGKVTKLLDTQRAAIPLADFEFVSEEKLLVIPNFVDNSVLTFGIK